MVIHLRGVQMPTSDAALDRRREERSVAAAAHGDRGVAIASTGVLASTSGSRGRSRTSSRPTRNGQASQLLVFAIRLRALRRGALPDRVLIEHFR